MSRVGILVVRILEAFQFFFESDCVNYVCQCHVMTVPPPSPIHSGRPADVSGVFPGDLIVSVNDMDATDLTHMELTELIKQGGGRGHLTLGIIRRMPESQSSRITPTCTCQTHTPSAVSMVAQGCEGVALSALEHMFHGSLRKGLRRFQFPAYA